jgi:hypothetical protein
MSETVELLTEPVVMTKEKVLTDPYLNVMQRYFINLSSFRRFIADVKSKKELKVKLKKHLSKYNLVYALKRPPAALQTDCLVLCNMAETLGNNHAL